jgi:hypothetical protein
MTVDEFIFGEDDDAAIGVPVRLPALPADAACWS